MKRVLSLFLLQVATLFIASGQSTPKAVFEKAARAVNDRNWKYLSECITTDDQVSVEMGQALAKLILLAKSGGYTEFYENHKERIRVTQPKALQIYFFGMAFVLMLPDFDVVADSGRYDQDKNEFVLNLGGRDISFKMDKQDGEYTFWPPYLKPDKKLITLEEMYDEYRSAILQPTEAETRQALEALVKKYVPGTTLAYENHPARGKIKGIDWNIVSGKAERKETFGKKMIHVTLASAEMPDDCRVVFAEDKVTFFVEAPGEYDFNLTGQNATLYLAETNSNVVVTDGKLTLRLDKDAGIVRGKITAKKDTENYVNGTFEVPICGKID